MDRQPFHKLFISFSLNGRAHLASTNKTSQISEVEGALKTKKIYSSGIYTHNIMSA